MISRNTAMYLAGGLGILLAFGIIYTNGFMVTLALIGIVIVILSVE